MRLDLTEIARTIGMRAVQEIDQACPADMDLECASNVKGSIRISHAGSLLLIQGKITTDVKFQCSRCLEDFSMPMEAQIEEQFRLERMGDAVTVLPLDEEEEPSELVRNNVLDVDELIRQNLLLVTPIKPLCKAECAGLCATCGENLNVRKCACPPAGLESPFRVLEDLLEDERE